MSPYRIMLAAVPVLVLGAQSGFGSGLGSGFGLGFGSGFRSSVASSQFPELDGDFAGVCQTAYERSHERNVEAVPPPLPEFDPPISGAKEGSGLVYEEYNKIQTNGWLYHDSVLWVTPRPRGNVHKLPLDVWYAPDLGRKYLHWEYHESDYKYWVSGVTPPLPRTIPAAARIIAGLEFGAAFGRSGSWPQIGYLGPSAYVRLTGLDTVFGSSLRLTGYNIGFVESKPRVTQVYVRALPYARLALLGVIENAPYTACFQMVVTPDLSTRAQTTLRFYPRTRYQGSPHAMVAPLAISSMFWKDEMHATDIGTDEAHDADHLAVCGQPSVPLRDVVPDTLLRRHPNFREVGPAACFGLVQLDRNPAHYKRYVAANYARRVSFWVDDVQSDLPYAIKLMAYGTNYEGEDNVVAYAEFQRDLPVPRSAADGATFRYTLTASDLPPPQPGPRVVVGETGPGDRVGQALAMSGETLAVGAPAIKGRPGSVYLFKRTPFGLIAQRQLTPHDGVAGDQFGMALAMEGDRLVVAARGAVYVFVRRGLDWAEQARLSVPNGDSVSPLGYAVATAGDRIAVGVPGDDGGAGGPMTDYGIVYVFRREGETWPREEILRAADREAWDHFGAALALDGNRLAIGAPGDDYPNAWEQGSVYLFERTATGWAQTAKLTEPGGWQDYGAALALSGNRLLVGQPRAREDGGRTATGAVCAYTLPPQGGPRSPRECFRPLDGRQGDAFGAAVSLRGSTAVIGAPGALAGHGVAWVYRNAKGSWQRGARLTGVAGAAEQFGTAVATDGASWSIGAPPVAGQTRTARGAAYLFPALAR
ncbi:glucan biosynthesis protein [uncultured Thiodictyon sp.]|uniref:glucan biosynthesis protein n=1 Tax=uncultured Thiodictyon sp. TaxID=1846217 RepID=UPI0025D4B2F6|nr:glucan biosynthesis protein [uncultured Thiodictyon sp.]